jgi:hypothetical protein
MSSAESNVVSGIDTDLLIENIDYEELFEGTALEGLDLENGSIAEEVGRALGEAIGRALGETIGSTLGAMLVPMLLDAGDDDAESEGTSGADAEGDGSEQEESDDE